MTYRKTKLHLAIITALGMWGSTAGAVTFGVGNNNFTMLDPGGGRVGGTNTVNATWDGTLNTAVDTAIVNMTISSDTTFMGTLWDAHDVMLFGPGEYTFETCPGPVINGKAADGSLCGSTPVPVIMSVDAGQVGAHMLFDWNGNVNIDVVNVWDLNAIWAFGPNDGNTKSILETQDSNCNGIGKKADLGSPECAAFFATEWLFASTDDNGDGIPGTPMVDGPFRGFNANFNLRPEVSAVPVPAAIWLMGSGLLGLLGVASKRKEA